MAQDDDTTARSFYDAGVAAYGAGRYEAALAAFTQGHELSGRPQFLFNMASCLDRLHRVEDALAMFRRFAEEVPDAENMELVQRRIAFLEAALEESRTEEAQGEEAVSGEVAVPDSGSEEPSETEVVEAAQAPETDTGRSAFLSAPAMTGFALGAAGLITFAVAGAVSWSQFSDLESSCAPGCTADETSASRRNALIADIGGGVGVAGAVFGLIYGLVAGPSDDEPRASVHIAPNRAGANLQVGGAF